MRAADTIVKELEGRITSGSLQHNQPLPPERGLMEEFGASRTVIREAIATLAQKGLLDARPRFRPIVKKPDYGTILDATGAILQHLLNKQGGVLHLYRTRVFIERLLVRDAALMASKETIAELKSALSKNYEAIPDSKTFFETDKKFHGVLYRAGGNPIFATIHEGFVAWLYPHWERMDRSVERNEINYYAHKAVFDAILERDPDRAETLLIKHLDHAWEFVKDTF